ncbi:MAG: hypothetical protein GX640_12785 [Fibrobacter sp.]|nr:hypothetical protein [Fibrobacter sp.]
MGPIRSVAVIGMLGAMVLTTGCASISNFQTAKPLGKGTAEALGATSFLTMANPLEPDSSITFRTFELQARVGLTEKLDIGLKYTFPTAGALDVKYCFLGSGKERGLFMSTGLQAGYTSFGSWGTDDDVDENTADEKRVEFYVPVYLSIYPLDFLSLSVIPSYGGRFYTFAKGYENVLGGNANVRIGKRFGVVLDFSLFRNFATEYTEKQVGIGAFVPLSQLFKR